MARKQDFNEPDTVELELDEQTLDEHTPIDVNRVGIPDIISLTARLAQLLAQEADYLDDMQVSQIAGLQKEKNMLTRALASVKKHVSKHPEMLEQMDEQEREDLVQVVGIFNQILEENYRRLAMARAVNQEIVKAITEVAQESARNDTYNQKGQSGRPGIDRVSVTLNERV